jgi:hypothetical protein
VGSGDFDDNRQRDYRDPAGERSMRPAKIMRKKNRGCPLSFFSSLSGVQTGIPSGPSGGIPSPSVGSELRLCRPFATLFYLSTLPTTSPSLPSAVGHSSVVVGSGNNTNMQKFVNPFFKYFFKKSFESLYLKKTNALAVFLNWSFKRSSRRSLIREANRPSFR